MQRPPLLEANGLIYWKNRFETYVKSKDIDLWHIIVNGDYKPTFRNTSTDRDETLPYERLSDENKKMLSKNNEAKMVLYNALPKKEYEKIFMCKTAKDIWNSLVITHQVIMEYLVNISKRRAFWSLNEDILKINDSDNQYAISIKEDTAYPCLHSPKTTKETSSIRRIQRIPILHIQDIVCEYSGRYQAWSLLQETLICRIQTLGYTVNLDNSTSNVLIPLDSWTSGLLEYKLPLSSNKDALCGCFNCDRINVSRMDDPNITMEEYISLEEEKARKRGKVFNWETAKLGKICGSYGPQFSESYSEASHINNSIPQKEKDLGSFTLPCFINNVCFDNALVDLGTSVSVMPLSTYLNLGLGELAHPKLIVELADRIVKYPKGIAKNVLVGIGKFTFPVDFIYLDMPEDFKAAMFLRRPIFCIRAVLD
ncbi:hypothetical protein Tco_0559812 [Tanacetum coccineum]